MESQTPLKHISTASKPPKRHAQRKKSSIKSRRSGSKIALNRTLRSKRNKLYKRFKKTSQRYFATLLDSTLSHIAETHSNSLARLASPIIPISIPSTTTPASPAPFSPPSLSSPLSTSTVKDLTVKNFLHVPTRNEDSAAAVATTTAVAAIIRACGETKPARLTTTNHDSRTLRTTNRNTSGSSDAPLLSPQQKRPSNSTVLESLRNLIQPLCLQISEEEDTLASKSDQINDIQSPFHKLNQHMTSFARTLAVKESELRSLWHDWDENTREIEELVKEVQDGRGDGIYSTSSGSKADVNGNTETDAHAHTPNADKQKQAPIRLPAFKTLEAQIEKASADAIDAMQAEVRNQQTRRRVVREKMLAVLKEEMIGSQ